MATINHTSSEAVKKATGKTWKEWITLLDKLGAERLTHKEIVKILTEKQLITNGWWVQQVTVGYEKAKKKRVEGETVDAGFQIGVQQTLPYSQQKVWDLINSKDGKAIWAKEAHVTLKTMKAGERLRLSYGQKGDKNPTTLQMTLVCPRNETQKTTVRFHQEKLPNGTERERMREHWKTVLHQLEQELDKHV